MVAHESVPRHYPPPASQYSPSQSSDLLQARCTLHTQPPCWLSPSTGDAHRSRIRTTLATDPAFSWAIPESEIEVSTAVEEFSQRMSQDTQVLFVSPFCDNDAKHAAQRLDASGYTVTVVSPDPTALDGPTPDCALGYASLAR